jgi:hypothetical protein
MIPAAPLPTTDLGPDSLLHFVHIPKTAGTSMRRYLDRFFLPQEVFPAEVTASYDALDVALAKSLDRSCLNRYRLVRGHHCIEQLSPFLDNCGKTLNWLTILRDPESQMVSEYKMSQADPNYPHHRELRGITFDEFLDHPKLPWIRRGNRMTGHLMNQYVVLEKAYRGLDEYFYFLTEKLADYAVVGIHDDMAGTLRLMTSVFGWYCPEEAPHFNKSKYADFELTEPQRSRIHELTNLDRKLYEWARHRFDQQSQRLLQSLLGRLDDNSASPSALCAAINLRSAKRREVRLANPVWRGYIEIVNSEGFRLCHLDRYRQRQIQWIGPNPQATITVGFSLPSDYVVKVEIVHWLKDEMLRDFCIRVNGEAIPLAHDANRGFASRTFWGIISRRVIERSAWNSEIVFETSGVDSPRALGLNEADAEQKCLAIGTIELLAAG